MACVPVKVIGQVVTPQYAIFHSDCIPVLHGMPDNSLHFTVSSWPFGSLYSYTDAIEDMSNIQDIGEFFCGMDFMLHRLFQVMIPGRLVATHCMQLPRTIETHGMIGMYDFRGDIIRAYEKHGFIYHSEVVIWKDPLVAATRTKAIGLAHKQIVADSALCRTGIPDYLVVMRKPGRNPEPIAHKPAGFTRWIGPPMAEPIAVRRSNPKTNKYSHEVWQRYASPVWFDIDPGDTLQFESAREDGDSRHICPLQKTVIRRALELWTNPGDVVFDPFAGIGSTGFVSIGEGRRFVGTELKETYFNQAVRNLAIAEEAHSQELLPGMMA